MLNSQSVAQSVSSDLSHSLRNAKENAPALFGFMVLFEGAKSATARAAIGERAVVSLSSNEVGLWTLYLSKKMRECMSVQAVN